MRKRQRRKKLERPEPMMRLLERTDDPVFAKFRAPLTPRQWEAVVGAHVATRTQPLKLENGLLLVRAATSSWAHELSLLHDTIVQKLSSLGYDVKEIRFRVGAIDPPLRPPPERTVVRQIPAGAELPAELRKSITDVFDEELRGAIEAAARQSIGYVTAMQRAARALPDAERESARPDRTTKDEPEAGPRSRAGERDRSR